MKRLLTSICAVLLLVGSVPLLMTTAEPEDPTAPTTSVTETETTATEGTESTTLPSETDTTDTTGVTETTGVAFVPTEYSREYDENTRTLSVSWNYAEGDGSDVMGVNVGGSAYSITGSQGRFTVDLSNLAPGVYGMQYILRLPDGSTGTWEVNPLEVSGNQALAIHMEIDGVTLRAWLVDEAGQAVPDYPLQVTVNGKAGNHLTNRSGEILVESTEEIKTVSCVAPSRTVGLVRYIGASASWKKEDGALTTQSDWDVYDTTTATRWSATVAPLTTGTVKTYATLQGAGTTAVEGSLVAMNVSFDEGVLDEFGLNKSEFQKKARLLMESNMYATLVGDTKATMMMTMGYNSFAISDQHISQLVSGKSKYSRYTDIKRVAVTLGLQFVDENKDTIAIPTAPEASYTVRMPVPKSMQKCPVLAVAMIEKDSLSHLIDVQVKNGYIEFVTNGFTSIAVLGFGDGAASAGGGVAWQLIALLVAGLAMLTGAGLLMYFFVWRKPATAATEEKTADAPANDLPREEIAEELAGDAGFMIAPIEDSQLPASPATDLYSHAGQEEETDLYSSDNRKPQA